MKQLELELKERLLVVEPKDLSFSEEKVIIALGDSERYISDLIGEKRELQFICKGSELTEEVAEGLVYTGSYIGTFNNYITNDNHKSNQKHSALDSFISAISAQGCYWGENPFNERINAGYTYEKWQEAESRTFNPEKSIIFKILS